MQSNAASAIFSACVSVCTHGLHSAYVHAKTDKTHSSHYFCTSTYAYTTPSREGCIQSISAQLEIEQIERALAAHNACLLLVELFHQKVAEQALVEERATEALYQPRK